MQRVTRCIVHQLYAVRHLDQYQLTMIEELKRFPRNNSGKLTEDCDVFIGSQAVLMNVCAVSHQNLEEDANTTPAVPTSDIVAYLLDSWLVRMYMTLVWDPYCTDLRYRSLPTRLMAGTCVYRTWHMTPNVPISDIVAYLLDSWLVHIVAYLLDSWLEHVFTGLGMGPLLEMAVAINPQIVVTALLGTSVIFACFSAAALTAERGRWLYLGGTLMSMLSAMLLLSLANLLFGSRLIFQVYLYIGLFLMCGFVLYDTQLIIEKRRQGDKDFVAHSVDLFIDFIGIFRRLIIILAEKRMCRLEYYLNVMKTCRKRDPLTVYRMEKEELEGKDNLKKINVKQEERHKQRLTR
ncbi:Bax inhibitor 1 [Homalodisca vitripennis]|nr:Bax inhibitor 1 [Homalodisca vitripennis]